MSHQRCTCGSTAADQFDARAAFDNLSHKYRELAQIVARYMNEAGLDPPTRVANARNLSSLIQRITGGIPTLGFPECCLIGHGAGTAYQWFCTGVLIHPRIVLTAGHCNVPPAGERVPTISTVGLNVQSQDDLSGADLITVKSRHTHPGYLETQQLHDVTVLVLTRDAKVTPVGVATTDELAAAADVTLVGFGNSDFNSSIGFGLKREVSVKFDALRTTAAQDLSADEAKYGFDSKLEFVAGGAGKDSCNGDSGGPAYIVANGARKVAGLTSRAAANATHACGESGIYSRVDANLDFVRQVATKAGIALGG